MKSSGIILIYLFCSILLPVVGYAFPLVLTDTQGVKHEVNVEMIFLQGNGQPLPDGAYTNKMGKTMTIKNGRIMDQGMMLKRPGAGMNRQNMMPELNSQPAAGAMILKGNSTQSNPKPESSEITPAP